ncbi:hypothetical protein ABW20_dc0110287 [Dactylellina cionopaga]|nr:hypothetical protein ABW20_dc0110287 [Dactylellina cionopaga]
MEPSILAFPSIERFRGTANTILYLKNSTGSKTHGIYLVSETRLTWTLKYIYDAKLPERLEIEELGDKYLRAIRVNDKYDQPGYFKLVLAIVHQDESRMPLDITFEELKKLAILYQQYKTAQHLMDLIQRWVSKWIDKYVDNPNYDLMAPGREGWLLIANAFPKIPITRKIIKDLSLVLAMEICNSKSDPSVYLREIVPRNRKNIDDPSVFTFRQHDIPIDIFGM